VSKIDEKKKRDLELLKKQNDRISTLSREKEDVDQRLSESERLLEEASQDALRRINEATEMVAAKYEAEISELRRVLEREANLNVESHDQVVNLQSQLEKVAEQTKLTHNAEVTELKLALAASHDQVILCLMHCYCMYRGH
jgi:hypothetical protein